MKKQLRYSLLILLFALLNAMATTAVDSVQEGRSAVEPSLFISQAQAQQESALNFYLIYSHTLNGVISIDHSWNDVKKLIRSSNLLDITKNPIRQTVLSEQSLDSSPHRNPIEYYVYTLEKIVT